jgi:pimeloyl-ACP methyl ester carboxylesterase
MQNYRDLYYQSDDGLTLYARHYVASGAPTLVCMPGLTRNSADFQWLCDHLMGQYNIYAMDFRGRGNSQWDLNAANYNPLTYARDLECLIHHQQLTDITLVGTSLGGLVAMIYLGHFAHSVRALVLNDIGPEVNPQGLNRIQQYVGKSEVAKSWHDAIAMVKSINAEFFPGLDSNEWELIARALMHETDDGQITFSYDPAIAIAKPGDDTQAIPNLWAEFDKLGTLPLLVLRGEFSDILDARCIQEMQRRHQSMDYCEVANRGHAPLLNEPQVVQALKKFLTAVHGKALATDSRILASN